MLWTVKIDGGPRRVNHAAVTINDKIYSFGGYCSGEPLRWRPMDVHILCTLNYRWIHLLSHLYVCTDESEVPFQRYGHTAVAYKNMVYIWGGRNDDIACNILYCFNTKTYEWSAPKVGGNIPGARDGHSACVIGNSMYIFGGFDEDEERFSQSVLVLDFETMCWRCLLTNNPAPSYRDFHTATVINNRMYIFGGRGDRSGAYHTQDEVYCSDIMYLDITYGEWHKPNTTGEKPLGRRSHSAFAYGGYIYIFGGYNGITRTHMNDLFRFCPNNNHWTSLKVNGIPPSPRRRQACSIIGDRLFLFGGTSPSSNATEILTSEDKLIDNDDLHILDFRPTLRTLCLITVIKYKLEQKSLPSILKSELWYMETPNNISRPLNPTG